MARNLYGCTSADFTLTESGRVVAGATATVWTARTGGTQITDLTDLDGDPITLVTSDADGGIRFYGVDGDKDTYWLDTGTGARIGVRPADLTGEIGPTPDLTIGTVTTGTAAATITGTDAAPVLNLTLPSAGANGVDTAAIQDSAVTAAKIANDTITATQVAANAIGSSELADNAVDTAAIADGAVTPAKMARQVGNLLTENQASVESDASGFAVGVNCTIARSTSQAYVGSASLAITATSTFFSANTLTGTSGIPVTPGETYTATFQMKAGSVARDARIDILWFKSNGTAATVDVVSSAYATNSTSAWTKYQITATAPSDAAFAAVRVLVTGTAASEVHYADCFGFWRGTGGQWALPGTPILGLTDAPIGNLLTLAQSSMASTGLFTQTSGSTEATAGAYTLGGTSGSWGAYTECPVEAGVTYTLRANLAPTGRPMYVRVDFLNSSGGYVTSDHKGNSIASGASGVSSVTVTAPATSVKAVLWVVYGAASGVTGNTVTVTSPGFWRGAAGQWSLPGYPVVGQSRIAVNGAVDLSGTGTPEGVVTAAPGSTWLQTDSTTDVKGWIKWVKATGTGNTGWVAGPEADTGWRDISSLINTTYWTPATGNDVPRVRRIGNRVQLTGRVTSKGAWSGQAIWLAPPTGFIAAAGQRFYQVAFTIDGVYAPGAVIYSNESGNIMCLRLGAVATGNDDAADTAVDLSLSWIAATTWLSSLPGSAA